MPTPSKFTEEVRRAVIDALAVGASRRTAATIAGVSPSQISRWLARGERAREGTRWHEFYLRATQAEAAPRMRALGVIYRELPNRPDLAWKFVERSEPGYAPSARQAPSPPAGPVVIQLALHDGTPLGPPQGLPDRKDDEGGG